LRNLDVGGPLRPSGNPHGDESNPHVAVGNRLWRRALALARLLLLRGTIIFIEHPRGSKAWLVPETRKLIADFGLHVVDLDWCMFPESPQQLRNRKPTRIVTSAAWLQQLAVRCDGGHVHDRPLRGSRAKAAAAYPPAFCQAFA